MSAKSLLPFAFVFAACASVEFPPLIEGRGEHHMQITTDSTLAATYFDQGLVLAYGFNHDEAVRAFETVARLDPDCAMAYWGQAYALGPNMNSDVDAPRAERAAKAIRRALELKDGASERERDLIDALAVRLAVPVVGERGIVNGAYSGAMRVLWDRYPEDPDVGFLLADALVNETPWELWTPDFEPTRNTLEAIAVLDRVLELDLRHPGANHFYIHAWEPSGQAQRAEAAADRLGALTPGLGHMVHMPSHIYVQVGRYDDCVRVNDEGTRLDREFFARTGAQGGYHLYQAHNTHFRVWSALYLGAYEEALEACRVLLDDLPDEFEARPASAVWLVMEQEVHLRFGNWQAVLDAPPPRPDQPIAQALWRYARAIAFANTGRIAEARAEAEAFEVAVATIPEGERGRFYDRVTTVVAIARAMMAGEIEYKAGNVERGLEHLRAAVAAEDELHYAQPSPWLVPTRHSLGALLLEQGLVEEAEQVYRHDLKAHAGNIWSLQGLHECLERSGRTAEAAELEPQLDALRALATVDVQASCYCRTVQG